MINTENIRRYFSAEEAGLGGHTSLSSPLKRLQRCRWWLLRTWRKERRLSNIFHPSPKHLCLPTHMSPATSPAKLPVDDTAAASHSESGQVAMIATKRERNAYERLAPRSVTLTGPSCRGTNLQTAACATIQLWRVLHGLRYNLHTVY